MKKVWKGVLAILLGILVNAAIILAFVLWCKHIDKTTPETSESLTSTIEVTATVTPVAAANEDAYTVTPVITEETVQMPVEYEPTKIPEVTEGPEISQALVVTVTPSPTAQPTVAPSPTAVPTVTPTVTPTPAPQRKYTYEAKMGDNVWYRLSEDRVLYVTGTGATVRFDYSYDKETDIIYGGDYHYDNLMKCNGAQHIVIEEGVTKLSSWSLMHLPNIQSITFPSSLQEIEDYCFVGTGMTTNTVWIGLDKSKVKLGKDAFYGTVYQTEEDLRKPTPIPTSTPTPTSLPMEANSFYKALVEEAGIMIDESEKEPYSAALVREGILKENEVKRANQKFANQEAALILYRTAQKFACEDDTAVVAAAKKYERISDQDGIYPVYEEAVYFCFGNGIMPGVSDGEYSHTRSFEPDELVREADGILYCKRLFDTEKRVPMSPDAQVIRTTNLPVQAKLYPYILESFPNIYYDANYLYMYNLGTDDRAFPDTAKQTKFLETWCTASTVEEFSKNQPERCRIFTSETDYLGFEKVGMNAVVERYRDTWEQQAREYLELVFNFDYRTVREDTEWQEKIKNLNAFYHEWGKGAYEGTCAGIAGIDAWMEQFLDNAETYHTVVECSEIDFDMSTLFYSERFDEVAPYTIRVHLRYKITSDFEPGYSELAEVLPVNMYGIFEHFTSFGEWKDVYAELTFDTNSFDRTGIGGVRVLEYNVDDAIRYHFDPKKYAK